MPRDNDMLCVPAAGAVPTTNPRLGWSSTAGAATRTSSSRSSSRTGAARTRRGDGPASWMRRGAGGPAAAGAAAAARRRRLLQRPPSSHSHHSLRRAASPPQVVFIANTDDREDLEYIHRVAAPNASGGFLRLEARRGRPWRCPLSAAAAGLWPAAASNIPAASPASHPKIWRARRTSPAARRRSPKTTPATAVSIPPSLGLGASPTPRGTPST